MGQNESKTVNYLISNESNEWTNYIEWTNFKNLKKGEKYRLIFESVEFELIFCYYFQLLKLLQVLQILMAYF